MFPLFPRGVVAAILVLGLSACGWHLRGSQTMDVSLPPVYLEFHNASAELRRDLNQTLASAQVNVVNQAAQAGLLLTIHNEQRGRRVLAVDSSGRVSEYELQYTLTFSARDRGGKVLIPQDSIVQQRDYRFDESQVLAKGEEEKKLFDFMRRMSIQALLRRLHALDIGAEADTPTQAEAESSNAN
ncbi:hypothetical protein Tel_02140 [Candidatus Tenderia electrophaga]|jgi:LPS-assembly lipoprotein|uniref:LPS-assembly lipoprotein LptE n=1 Tax=Candidatus Tenderia electrophaga TaxID=1748243 RepID=A0A0S2TA84_9GAMM|nr:hypothetical protein Tel_02140 [Candidatus Tenderia electrophaga]